MYIVAIGWVYVVLMMAVAEATSSQGTVLGAVFTFLLYGVLPLSIVLYLMGAPGRRKARKAQEAAEAAEATADLASTNPNGSSHAPGDAIPPEREKP